MLQRQSQMPDPWEKRMSPPPVFSFNKVSTCKKQFEHPCFEGDLSFASDESVIGSLPSTPSSQIYNLGMTTVLTNQEDSLTMAGEPAASDQENESADEMCATFGDSFEQEFLEEDAMDLSLPEAVADENMP